MNDTRLSYRFQEPRHRQERFGRGRFLVRGARLVIFACAVIWCGSSTAASAADTSPTIEVQSVVLRLVLEAEVPAQEPGLLTAVNVREGQSVKQGEVLAQLDDRNARMAERAAELAYRVAREKAANDVRLRYARKTHQVAKAELERSNESIEQFPKSVSQSQIDVEQLTVEKTELEQEQAAFESQLDELEAQIKEHELRAAQLVVQQRRIVAPFDGVVVQVYARLGEWMEPGQKAVRLVNVERLKAEGFLSASEARYHLENAPVRLTVSDQDGATEEYRGRIVFVSPEIDPITHQVRVWAEIDNRELGLRPGQSARMVIQAAGGTTRQSRQDALAEQSPSP